MNSAETVVQKFGGSAKLSKLTGKGQSTFSYWIKKGVIPSKWQPILMQLAQENNVDLRAEDFMPSEIEILKPAAHKADAIPKATHWGELEIDQSTIPCYVLDDGQRVFSLKGIVVGLIGTKGGQLAEYLKVSALRPFLPEDLKPAEDGSIAALVKFDTGAAAFSKYAWGFPVERFVDLCSAYSQALQEHAAADNEFRLTHRQIEIANKASSFLMASAKTGIVALVDEATGYQYVREQDALQLKYKLYLEEEMRKWEKTFPDQLWVEFGRLTNWSGTVHQRPKYWGKLVMELIYGYLDTDVAKWLKDNAPKPMKGQNYHQWLSSQYGLKKLTEHLWMIIGIASTCHTMPELRKKVAERFGRIPVQMTLYLDPQR
jgi:hypothetical protein